MKANAARACWALILAAGSGKRLGVARPKAFVSLAGHPLICWSLRAFAHHEAVTDLLIVTPPSWDAPLLEEVLAALAERLGDASEKIRGAVSGGNRRQDSVRLGLRAVREMMALSETEPLASGDTTVGTDPDRTEASAGSMILVHDAARPIVPSGLIDEIVVRLSAPHPGEPVGVVPVVPIDDTLKEVTQPEHAGLIDGKADQGGHEAPESSTFRALGRVKQTVSRAGLWRAQTPQAFTLDRLLEVHEEAHAAGFEATDDAMLYEWKGWRVEAVWGSPANIKVTYPEDLALLTQAMPEVS